MVLILETQVPFLYEKALVQVSFKGTVLSETEETPVQTGECRFSNFNAHCLSISWFEGVRQGKCLKMGFMEF